jgi:NAD(P)-dependent dehydrogenase (short-subunit alcohol dehydrogenase family)
MDLGLESSVVYVTGGSAGIGRSIIDRLLAEGAMVATCARNGDRLRRAYADVDPRRVQLDTCDVTDPAVLRSAVERSVERFGRLDGVVANAGAGTRGDVLEAGLQAFDQQFVVKTHPVLTLVRAAMPHLGHSPHPSVVVMNGVTAHAPDPEMAAVSTARAAVASLVALLARRLAAEGIRVNAVNVGTVVTNRQRERHAVEAPEAAFEDWCLEEAARRGIPLGRMGLPEEVAPAVALLLSPLAAYITGTAVDVAGGLDARA